MRDLAALESVYHSLFDDRDMNVYAVLDGAAMPSLPELLWDREPEYVCLYAGDLQPDVAAVAPYLVKLERTSRFTDIAMMRVWGKSRGVFAVTDGSTGLAELSRHFRRFLLVRDYEGGRLYFRFYDPRVLRTYLPTCNAEELDFVFGPVRRFVAEDGTASTLLHFSRNGGGLIRVERHLESLPD
jgi:hypothetical protein